MMPAVINNKVRLVVKIFASLKTISDVVAMPKGPRALATWFAVFTGIYPLFDFVDVSEEKFIPLKISGMFSMLRLLSNAYLWDYRELRALHGE
jgi:hypothetical protein